MSRKLRLLYELIACVVFLILASYLNARRVGDRVILVVPRQHAFIGQRLVWYAREKPVWRGIAWGMNYEPEVPSTCPGFVIVSLFGNFIDSNVFYYKF
jgi:hypothetical protein